MNSLYTGKTYTQQRPRKAQHEKHPIQKETKEKEGKSGAIEITVVRIEICYLALQKMIKNRITGVCTLRNVVVLV